MGSKRKRSVDEGRKMSMDEHGAKVCTGRLGDEMWTILTEEVPSDSPQANNSFILEGYLNAVLLKERLLHAESVGYMGSTNKRAYLHAFLRKVQKTYGRSYRIYNYYFKRRKNVLIGNVFSHEFDSPGETFGGDSQNNGLFRYSGDSISTPANVSVDYAHYKRMANIPTLFRENGMATEGSLRTLENETSKATAMMTTMEDVQDGDEEDEENDGYKHSSLDYARLGDKVEESILPSLWMCLYSKIKIQMFRVCKFLHINLHVAFNSISLFSSIFCNITCKTDKQIKSLFNYIFGQVPQNEDFMKSIDGEKAGWCENNAIIPSRSSNGLEPSYVCMLYLVAAFCITISLYQHNTSVRFDLICILYFLTFLDTIICDDESLKIGTNCVTCGCYNDFRHYSRGTNTRAYVDEEIRIRANVEKGIKCSSLDVVWYTPSLPCILTPGEKSELLKRKDATNADNFIKHTACFYTNLIQHKFGFLIAELKRGRLLKIVDQHSVGSSSSLSHFFLLSTGMGISMDVIRLGMGRMANMPKVPIILLYLLSNSVFFEYIIGNTLFSKNLAFNENGMGWNGLPGESTNSTKNDACIEVANSPESIKAALVLRFIIDIFCCTRNSMNKRIISDDSAISKPEDKEVIKIMHIYCNTLTRESLVYVRNNYAINYFVILQIDWVLHKSGLYTEDDYIRHNELFSTYERYISVRYGECLDGTSYTNACGHSDPTCKSSLMRKFENHEIFYRKVAASLFDGDKDCVNLFNAFFDESFWVDGEIAMDRDYCNVKEDSLISATRDSPSTKFLLYAMYRLYMSILKSTDYGEWYMFSNDEIVEMYYPDVKMDYTWNPYDAIYSRDSATTLKELAFRSKLALLES